MARVMRIGSESFVCELAADTPAAVEVPRGATLAIHCRSALDQHVGMAGVRPPSANPATGPIAVAGAQPGQALSLDILDIACESPGHVAAGPDGGHQAVEIRRGRAIFRGLAVPLAPMIGVLGVAPPQGSWSTMDAGPFGGNLDTNDIAPGASVHVPIHQLGGRLVLGDVHAVMGDGEIGGQGLEVAATVTLRVGIDRQPISDHVVIRRGGRIMTVGTGRTLELAVADASDAMVRLLVAHTDLDAFQARKFLGLTGQTLFGQHCCPVKTVRVAMPLRYLRRLRRRQG